MRHQCEHFNARGRRFGQRIADPNQHYCFSHRGSSVRPLAQTSNRSGCVWDHYSARDWRCLAHSGDAWETAQAMGMEIPCRIPLPLDMKITLACEPRLASDTIALLGRERNRRLLALLASHKNLPEAVAQRLATHPVRGVLRALAANAAVPPQVLASLAQHPVWSVRLAVADNPAAPLLIMKPLAADSHVTVRALAGSKLTKQRPTR